MAKQRIQVGPLADPVPLTPRASPVDTFHAPDVQAPRTGPTEMAQLSEALSQFNPHLLALGVDLHREQAANENTAGAEKIRTDARLQNRKGFNDAIKAGLIPEAKSPYFLKGMQEQLGRIESDRYDVALREAYTNAQSQHQPDITDFIGGFTSTYLEKHGLEGGAPEFQAVFQNNISASISNLQAQHVSRWQEEQSKLVRDRLYQETSFAVDSLVYRSPEDQAKDIKNRLDTLVTNGLSGTDANKAVVDAITDKAKEHGDASILDLLNHIDTGNGKLGGTNYARDQKDAAEKGIFAEQRQKDTYEWSQREHQRKVVGENLMSQAAQRIGEDPLANISDLTTQAEKFDPEMAKKMREYKDYVTTLSHKVYDDPETTANIYADIYKGTATPTQAIDLVRRGKLSPDRLPFVLRDMEEAGKHQDMLQDPSVNKVIEETGRSLEAGDGFIPTPESKADALRAKNLLSDSVIQFMKKNPDASRIEAYEEVRKKQDIVLKGIAPSLQKPLPPSVTNGVLGNPTPAAQPAAASPETPASKPLYASTEDLKAAASEYNTAGDKSRLAIEANALGYSDVNAFIKDQLALLRKAAPKK